MFGSLWRGRVLILSAALTLAMIVMMVVALPAHADSTQAYASVSLQDFTIQVQYPSVVLPGTNAQVHVQATAKSSVTLYGLTAYVYYVDANGLHQLASATIVGAQSVASGNSFTSNIPIFIPLGMSRTSLFATFTESVKYGYVSSYSYSYSSNYYGNYYDCSSYPSYSYDNQYCSYYPYYNSYSYPQYSYVTITDTGVSPLSYVNATTPEYTSLLSQYQAQQQQLSQTQAQIQNLQQQVNQQNQQNQQLQNNLQNAQGTISQANSNNSNLTSQLSDAQTTNRHLIYLVIAFGIIAIAALALGQRSGRPKKTQSVNPYAANYVPPQTERSQYSQ